MKPLPKIERCRCGSEARFVARHVQCMREFCWIGPTAETGVPSLSETIKHRKDRAYIQFLDEMSRPLCLGQEAKLKLGQFTSENLSAHEHAYQLFGEHKALAKIWSEVDDLERELNKLREENQMRPPPICDHDLAERETECADGVCPICLRAQLEQARKESLEFIEKLLLSLEKSYPHIVIFDLLEVEKQRLARHEKGERTNEIP